MSDCVFCRIIAGTECATFVSQWVDTVAIIPLNPVVAGHTLVIPRRHVADFTEDPFTTAITMQRAAELTGELKLAPANLITSAGREATQSVFHLHVHIVPRSENDGLALPWYSGKRSKRLLGSTSVVINTQPDPPVRVFPVVIDRDGRVHR